MSNILKLKVVGDHPTSHQFKRNQLTFNMPPALTRKQELILCNRFIMTLDIDLLWCILEDDDLEDYVYNIRNEYFSMYNEYNNYDGEDSEKISSIEDDLTVGITGELFDEIRKNENLRKYFINNYIYSMMEDIKTYRYVLSRG